MKKERKRRNNPRRSRVSSYNVAALVKHPFDLVSSFAPATSVSTRSARDKSAASNNNNGDNNSDTFRGRELSRRKPASVTPFVPPLRRFRIPLPLNVIRRRGRRLNTTNKEQFFNRSYNEMPRIFFFFFSLHQVVIGKCHSNEFLEELVDNIFLARI